MRARLTARRLSWRARPTSRQAWLWGSNSCWSRCRRSRAQGLLPGRGDDATGSRVGDACSSLAMGVPGGALGGSGRGRLGVGGPVIGAISIARRAWCSTAPDTLPSTRPWMPLRPASRRRRGWRRARRRPRRSAPHVVDRARPVGARRPTRARARGGRPRRRHAPPPPPPVELRLVVDRRGDREGLARNAQRHRLPHGQHDGRAGPQPACSRPQRRSRAVGAIEAEQRRPTPLGHHAIVVAAIQRRLARPGRRDEDGSAGGAAASSW